ncbi:FixH [Roseovarius albus]|uniref:FixH n=1 Tax=Roseovarius albus TaxID=1247867 RepID=A0A1X6Y550_9RHOB|nr:FixH family protein [Roseovarius albus]SLN10692.1 FixH [Roseovarius albus]
MAERQITGRQVFIGFAIAFGVIISVNLWLAWSAVTTFPGLEVKNSYVASQSFDEDRVAQEALGWSVQADYAPGVLTLAITDKQGQPVKAQMLQATVGRATHVAEDVTPEFQYSSGTYIAPILLGDGNWNIRMVATAQDGTEFRQRVVMHKE